MKNIILAFTFLIIFSNLYSQTVIVKGNAKSYAGDTLEIYSYSDYITKNRHSIQKSYVDKEGYFLFNFKINETTQIFIDLQVFKGILFAEPGNIYEIYLPKKTLKDKEDELNPYFLQQEFYIRQTVDDTNSLNNKIFTFDTLYTKLYNKTLLSVKNKKTLDFKKIQQKLQSIYAETENEFLNNYKFYKILYLSTIYYNSKPEKVLNEHFSEKKILYQNPAYNEAFQYIISKHNFSPQIDTAEIESSYTWQNFNNISKKTSEIFSNENFREYYILTKLYFDFYNRPEQQKNIIKLFQSASSLCKNPIHKQISQTIVLLTEHLIAGTQAPNFVLKSTDNAKYTTADFKGKFLYLAFFSPGNYACEKDYEPLKNLAEKKHDKLQIAVANLASDYSDFMNNKKPLSSEIINLHINPDSEVLKNYKVVSFPTYFLINPAGNIILMPAPGPADNFEQAYYKHYQQWFRNELRNKGYSDKSLIPN